jgi:hypothetical protein
MAMLGQTPWAQAQHYDWNNPGSNMAMLPEAEIIKLLGLQPPQASTPAASPYAGAPQGAAPPQPVQRTPLPPPETEPTAPKPMKTAQASRPDFSVQPTDSDFLGGLLQGMGGMAAPIGKLVSSQSGNARATQSKNLTYDWLQKQGLSPEDAEMVVRNPDLMKGVLTSKFGVGERPSSVKEWVYYNSLSPENQKRYITMKRADKWLDTGTAFVNPNPVQPGAPTASIPKDVAGVEEQKDRGKARVDLHKVEDNARTTLAYIDAVLNDKNLPNVTGWQAYLPTVFAESVDTEERINQLKGSAFLTAFESLKGGGQITEIEGKKATDAKARLENLKQSDAGYLQALRDFRQEVLNLVEVARRKAGASAPPTAPGTTGGGWSIQKVQ